MRSGEKDVVNMKKIISKNAISAIEAVGTLGEIEGIRYRICSVYWDCSTAGSWTSVSTSLNVSSNIEALVSISSAKLETLLLK